MHLPLAEVCNVEQPAEQAAGGIGDDDRSGLGKLLQPGGEVRGLAHHCLLARRTLAQKVADDHEARRDPEPRREGTPGTSSPATASTTASPAWTARSASSSRVRGQPK